MKNTLMALVGNRKRAVPLPEFMRGIRISYIDIGARGGPPASWLSLSDCIEYVCFEPDQEEASQLADQFSTLGNFRATVVQKALGSSTGKATLHLTKFRPSSSLLRPRKSVIDTFATRRGFDVEATTPIPLSSLDYEMMQRTQACDFIKADVQGYELEVLKGAERSLEQVVGCELEVSFLEIYENQPLWADLDEHMRSKGFFLADFERVWWRRAAVPPDLQLRGIMAYGNATYLRNDITAPRDRREAIRNALVSLATGLDELAYEIVHASARSRIFTDQEKQCFDLWLGKRNQATAFWARMARRMSGLPGRQTIGRWLGLWSRCLAGDSDTCADSESWLRRNSW